LAPPAARPGLVGGKRARTVSLTPCWCPQRPTSYVWWAHRSSRGELAQPPGWQRRSQQRARRCGYPVPPRACGIRRSRRGRSLGRSAGPTRAKNMCPPKPARGLASIGRRTVPRCARVSAGDMAVWVIHGSYRGGLRVSLVRRRRCCWGWSKCDGAQATGFRQGLCRQRGG
jgi:hypothetical protein